MPAAGIPSGAVRPVLKASGRRTSDRQGGRRLTDRRPREKGSGPAVQPAPPVIELSPPGLIEEIVGIQEAETGGEEDAQDANLARLSTATDALPTSRDDTAIVALFRRLRGPAQLARNNDPVSLRDHLVLIHTPLVEHCARNFMASGEPLEDLLQEGYLGLIKAVDRFDPDKGVRFSTYSCHLITGEIRHYLRDLGKIIHEPGWHSELRQRIARTTDQLTQKLGRAPRPEDIAESLNIRVESVREVLKNQQVLVVDSLDSSDLSDGDDREAFARSDEFSSVSRPAEPLVDNQLLLKSALPQLRDLEKQAIQFFFFEELSKTEIAQRLGISVNYAAYLIKQGTQHLRQIIESDEGVSVEATPAQMRAAYLLAQLKNASQSNRDATAGGKIETGKTARTAKERAKAGARNGGDLTLFAEFVEEIDEEVRRATRYGQDLSILWMHITNWKKATSKLDAAPLARATHTAFVIAQRCVRDVDKIFMLPETLVAGLHVLVIMPHTGAFSQRVADRMQSTLSADSVYPVNSSILDELQIEIALAVLPRDGSTAEALFRTLGTRLTVD